MDKINIIIKFLEEEITELESYTHDDNYSDLEIHDLNISIKEYKRILDYVKRVEKEDEKVTEFNGLSKERNLAISILNIFEDMLSEKDIMIPDEDREGNEDEGYLYGTTYYELEDEITSLLEGHSLPTVG